MNLAISEFGPYGKRLIDLCNSIKLRDGITKDEIMNAGFTNHYKPNLYYCTRVNKSNHPIDNIFPKPTSAEEGFKILSDYLLGDDWIHICQ